MLDLCRFILYQVLLIIFDFICAVAGDNQFFDCRLPWLSFNLFIFCFYMISDLFYFFSCNFETILLVVTNVIALFVTPPGRK